MWDLKQKLINWRFKVAENIYKYISIDKKYSKIFIIDRDLTLLLLLN